MAKPRQVEFKFDERSLVDRDSIVMDPIKPMAFPLYFPPQPKTFEELLALNEIMFEEVIYKFVPQPDITGEELTKIVFLFFMTPTTTEELLQNEFHTIKRHFKEVE